MWYNCTISVDVLFDISVDAPSEGEALNVAVTEALKRVKLPTTVSILSSSVTPDKDQSSGKVR